MARPQKRITVRGKQRRDIDPLVFLQVLLAIGEDWDQGAEPLSDIDVFQAAIEDQRELRP